MTDVGFLDASDPRMVSTMKQLEAVLARGPHMFRYEAADDSVFPERLSILAPSGASKLWRAWAA